MKGKKLKVEMAMAGYYNTSDFAKLIGLSKQAVSKSPNERFKRVVKSGRPWYKFDNGEMANSLYPKEYKVFSQFIDFGMDRRARSTAIATMPVEVKRVSSDKVSIRFYNEFGDMISALVSSDQIERIDHENEI